MTNHKRKQEIKKLTDYIKILTTENKGLKECMHDKNNELCFNTSIDSLLSDIPLIKESSSKCYGEHPVLI